MEDLMWKERQARWKIREAVREEERKRARVWIRKNRAIIEGKWWFWDKKEKVLRNRMGRKRERGMIREREGDRRRRKARKRRREKGGKW